MKGADEMGREGMHEKRREVKGQDGAGWEGREIEGKFRIRRGTDITPHLDNITQILDIALLCIN